MAMYEGRVATKAAGARQPAFMKTVELNDIDPLAWPADMLVLAGSPSQAKQRPPALELVTGKSFAPSSLTPQIFLSHS